MKYDFETQEYTTINTFNMLSYDDSQAEVKILGSIFTDNYFGVLIAQDDQQSFQIHLNDGDEANYQQIIANVQGGSKVYSFTMFNEWESMSEDEKDTIREYVSVESYENLDQNVLYDF